MASRSDHERSSGEPKPRKHESRILQEHRSHSPKAQDHPACHFRSNREACSSCRRCRRLRTKPPRSTPTSAPKGAQEIRVCTLYLKPKSIFKPNHYVKTTSKWIIFPWERLEAINLIKRNLRSKGKSINVIRELKGSGLSASLIRSLLALTYDN